MTNLNCPRHASRTTYSTTANTALPHIAQALRLRINNLHRIIHLHPPHERPRKRIPHKPPQLHRQLQHLLPLTCQILVLFLPQITPGRKRAVYQPFLVLSRVGARTVIAPTEHHQCIARLELGLADEGSLGGRGWGRLGVSPEVGARDEAGGAVGDGGAFAGHEEPDAVVAAQGVGAGGWGPGVVDGIVAVEEFWWGLVLVERAYRGGGNGGRDTYALWHRRSR